MNRIKCWIFLGLVLSIYAEHASANDPYNALVWNRNNHLLQNGKVDRGDWYEWWYYKVIHPQTGEAFYFTYGVVNPWDLKAERTGSRSFVSFGDFREQRVLEAVYPTKDFQSRYDRTWVKIGSSLATDQHLQGAIKSEKGEATWDLQVKYDWGWNAMGWAMHVPGISNIFWYPVQSSTRMSGWIESLGRRVELNDAPAYQDRNWGRSFPKWWAWLVSNQFENSPGTVLSAGGGRPKFMNHFDVADGFVVGLRHQGKEYSFRVNDGDTIKLQIRYGEWKVSGQNKRGQRIRITGYAPPEKFMILKFKTPQGADYYDYEALTGEIRVELEQSQGTFVKKWTPIADLKTHFGGIEYGSYLEDPSHSYWTGDRKLLQ